MVDAEDDAIYVSWQLAIAVLDVYTSSISTGFKGRRLCLKGRRNGSRTDRLDPTLALCAITTLALARWVREMQDGSNLVGSSPSYFADPVVTFDQSPQQDAWCLAIVAAK